MQTGIVRRIATRSGAPRLCSVLAEELSGADLQSLLLSVYQYRAGRLGISDILHRHRRSALMAPSNVDARLLNAFDRAAFAAAETFEAVELSPVCPLGAQRLLGNTAQNNVLTTIRNCELLGDPTPAMALECARRRARAAGRRGVVTRLCSSHRPVRLQPFDVPGFTPHFRLFGAVTAGRDTGSNAFELETFREHIALYLELFRALNREGFSLTRPLVELSDLSITETLLAGAGVTRDEVNEAVRAHRPGSSERFLAARGITLPAEVRDPATELQQTARQHGFEGALFRLALLHRSLIQPLQDRYPEAAFRFNLARLEGLGYYSALCLRISPATPDGIRYPVVDGGLTGWTARLLQDRKERLLATGIGSEFVCRRYQASPA